LNNKEFITELSQRLGKTQKQTSSLSQGLVECMLDFWRDGDSVSIGGFGMFEVRKKMERILVNPSTHQRMLIPPKLSLGFKPSSNLKDRMK